MIAEHSSSFFQTLFTGFPPSPSAYPELFPGVSAMQGRGQVFPLAFKVSIPWETPGKPFAGGPARELARGAQSVARKRLLVGALRVSGQSVQSEANLSPNTRADQPLLLKADKDKRKIFPPKLFINTFSLFHGPSPWTSKRLKAIAKPGPSERAAPFPLPRPLHPRSPPPREPRVPSTHVHL